MHGQLLPRFAQLSECVRVLAPLLARDPGACSTLRNRRAL